MTKKGIAMAATVEVMQTISAAVVAQGSYHTLRYHQCRVPQAVLSLSLAEWITASALGCAVYVA